MFTFVSRFASAISVLTSKPTAILAMNFWITVASLMLILESSFASPIIPATSSIISVGCVAMYEADVT